MPQSTAHKSPRDFRDSMMEDALAALDHASSLIRTVAIELGDDFEDLQNKYLAIADELESRRRWLANAPR